MLTCRQWRRLGGWLALIVGAGIVFISLHGLFTGAAGEGCVVLIFGLAWVAMAIGTLANAYSSDDPIHPREVVEKEIRDDPAREEWYRKQFERMVAAHKDDDNYDPYLPNQRHKEDTDNDQG